MRLCAHCSSPLSPLKRADARWCGGRCAVAAHRLRASLPFLPLALTDEPRWVRFETTKRPIQANGRAASSTNPATWTDYDTARASNVGAGLGFVLNGDGLVCLDFDHCFDGANLAPWTASLLDRLPPTYVERSPSGSGLHVWGFASLDFSGRRVAVPGGEVEVYGSVRYMTVTGDALTTTRELGDLSAFIASLIR